jgi:hypothetical protein
MSDTKDMRAIWRGCSPKNFKQFAALVGDHSKALDAWKAMIEEDNLGKASPRMISREDLQDYAHLTLEMTARHFGCATSAVYNMYADFGIPRREKWFPKSKAPKKDAAPMIAAALPATPHARTPNQALSEHNKKYAEAMRRNGLPTECTAVFRRSGDSDFAGVRMRIGPTADAYACREVSCPNCGAFPVTIQPVRGILWTENSDNVDMQCFACQLVIGNLDVDPRGYTM